MLHKDWNEKNLEVYKYIKGRLKGVGELKPGSQTIRS